MKEQDKKILIYFACLAAIIIIVIIYMNYQIVNPLIIIGNNTTKDTFAKIVNVKKQDIFNTMANLSDYPKVLPQNYLLAPLDFLPKSNLEHAMDTIITSFVEYTKWTNSG